ncbi:MAG: hypothetical protein QQN55_08335 [Nitrosopumilus sp.]
MTFKKWYKSEYKLHKVNDDHPAYLLMEKSWNASKKEESERCAKIAYECEITDELCAEYGHDMEPEDIMAAEIGNRIKSRET